MDGRVAGKRSWWILVALIAASIEPLMVKIGYQRGATTWQLLAYRNLFAAAAIVGVGFSFYGKKFLSVQSVRIRDVWRVVPSALLLMATNGLVIYALAHVSTLWTVTVMTTTPAFVALVNQTKGRVTLGPRFWLGFLLCFLGVMLSVEVLQGRLLEKGFSWEGGLALALAVMSSTIYRSRMDDLTQIFEPRIISTAIFVINALLVSMFLVPWMEPISVAALPLVAWTGCAAALANVAFISAIRVFGSTQMSLFDMLQRPLVIVGAALILHEPLTWLQGLGVVLVGAGIQLAKGTWQKKIHFKSQPTSLEPPGHSTLATQRTSAVKCP